MPDIGIKYNKKLGYDILTLDKIYLQIPGLDYSTILLIVIIVVVVVALIIMAMLILNRRPSRKSNFSPRKARARKLDYKNYPYEMHMRGEGSPIETVLEMLRRDLEDLSIEYSSGKINNKDYQEKVAEIKKTLQDLKDLREIIPETKNCNNCNTEILKDALFCDRCGKKQS